jgi:predicted ATP-grasp superfamily ATP-dependent carboligase
MPTVLLTDPEQRASLAAARALARAGYRVVTMGASRGLAGWSRAVARHVHVADQDVARADALVAATATIVRRESVQVVVPVSDAASRALLGADIHVGAAVAGPSAEAYARASDKAHLLQVATRCGLRVPRQQTRLTRDDGTDAGMPWTGPIVVKPSRSVVEAGGQALKVGVRFVEHPVELPGVLASYPAEAYPLLLQERTFGEGVGVFLLRHDGITLLSFAHRRLREKPPAGGVSTYREAIVPPPSLLAQCERLLDALGYSGPAMVEFKRDESTGAFVLMEINARLWGSLQLAIDAGVDFPSALVALALGRPLPPPPAPRIGVRSVWELGELDHALALLRRSPAELHLPPGARTGWRPALGALADHRWSDRPEVFHWSDPLPFVHDVLRWIRGR